MGVDPDSTDQMDDFLEGFEDETGIDLERTSSTPLPERSLWTAPQRSRTVPAPAPSEVIEALLLVGVENPAGIIDGLDKLVELLAGEGLEVQRDEWEGHEMATIHIDELASRGYTPEYVVTDRWAVLGTNVDGIEAFQEASTGSANRWLPFRLRRA